MVGSFWLEERFLLRLSAPAAGLITVRITSIAPSEDKSGILVQWGKKYDGTAVESAKFDFVFSSLDAKSLTNASSIQHSPDSIPNWSSALSATNEVRTTVVRLPNGTLLPLKNCGISWGSPVSGIIGAIAPGRAFENYRGPFGSDLLVFHEPGAVDAQAILNHVRVMFPGVANFLPDAILELEKFSETLPACPVQYPRDLLQFNLWRTNRFGPRLQVMGKHYYAVSGSPSEVLADLNNVLDRVDEGADISESQADWMNRCGKSLDGKYFDLHVPVVK